MPSPKKEHPKEKAELHPRNKHRERYNFRELIGSYPDLRSFVRLNDYGDESIDFFDPLAVLTLNKAIIRHFYHVNYWEIPKSYLCPPIPGRADYIHYAADLLAQENHNSIPRGEKIKVLDVGVGANCIYPIIGTIEYGWSFVGSDIDPVSIESARKIVAMNENLRGHIECRLQPHARNIFHGVIQEGEFYDLTVCNPPFHASAADAQSGTLRKLSNLKRKKIAKPVLNFGGKSNELWCEGGEGRFVSNMITESKTFSNSCLWFTTLISKQSSLTPVLKQLKDAGAEVKTIPMSQGNKASRIVAWTFLTPDERLEWVNRKWQKNLSD